MGGGGGGGGSLVTSAGYENCVIQIISLFLLTFMLTYIAIHIVLSCHASNCLHCIYACTLKRVPKQLFIHSNISAGMYM